MRDIRADLEDRAQILKDQIKSTQSAFEQDMEKIQREHENKLEQLKSARDAVNSLLQSESRRLNGAQAPDTKSYPQERSVRKRQTKNADLKKKLADYIIRELSSRGPTSKANLLKLVANGDGAEDFFEETLAQLKKTGLRRHSSM